LNESSAEKKQSTKIYIIHIKTNSLKLNYKR